MSMNSACFSCQPHYLLLPNSHMLMDGAASVSSFALRAETADFTPESCRRAELPAALRVPVQWGTQDVASAGAHSSSASLARPLLPVSPFHGRGPAGAVRSPLSSCNSAPLHALTETTAKRLIMQLSPKPPSLGYQCPCPAGLLRQDCRSS